MAELDLIAMKTAYLAFMEVLRPELNFQDQTVPPYYTAFHAGVIAYLKASGIPEKVEILERELKLIQEITKLPDGSRVVL